MPLAAALFLAPASAFADGGAVKASCSQDGTVVYREEIPAGAPAERRLLIASMHPKALCVFLDRSVSAQSMPDGREAVPADESIAGGDESLAAALAVIASGKTGDAYPEGMAAFVRESGAVNEAVRPSAKPSAKAGGQAGRFLNLAVGVYRNVGMADVMAHWKAMQAGTKVLSRMTPTVNASAGVTMVSVEGVPDELAAELCEEASAKGSGCLAVY